MPFPTHEWETHQNRGKIKTNGVWVESAAAVVVVVADVELNGVEDTENARLCVYLLTIR